MIDIKQKNYTSSDIVEYIKILKLINFKEFEISFGDEVSDLVILELITLNIERSIGLLRINLKGV